MAVCVGRKEVLLFNGDLLRRRLTCVCIVFVLTQGDFWHFFAHFCSFRPIPDFIVPIRFFLENSTQKLSAIFFNFFRP
jgi:hypothetical protein